MTKKLNYTFQAVMNHENEVKDNRHMEDGPSYNKTFVYKVKVLRKKVLKYN